MSDPAIAIAMLGPPGSGKSSLADVLDQHAEIGVIRTGQMIRREMDQGSDLGREASRYVERGDLVPDELVNRILDRELDRRKSAVVLLDGYPRSGDQTRHLAGLLRDNGMEVGGLLRLCLPREVAGKRLQGRMICPRCGAVYNRFFNQPRDDMRCDRDGAQLVRRPDDEPNAVRRRMKKYEVLRDEVVAAFEEQSPGRVFRVDGNQNSEALAQDVYELIMDPSRGPIPPGWVTGE